MKKNYSSPVIRVISVKQSVISTSGTVSTSSTPYKTSGNDYLGGYDPNNGWETTNDPD